MSSQQSCHRFAPKRSIAKEAIRAVASCSASALLGYAYGRLIAISGPVPSDQNLWGLVWAGIGLIMSIMLVYALRRGPWFIGLVAIAVPTAAVAYIGGKLAWTRFGMAPSIPIWGAGITAVFYATACVVYGVIMRRRATPTSRAVCQSCGYGLIGLSESSVCPECGTAIPRSR